jgi:hypothetical protein
MAEVVEEERVRRIGARHRHGGALDGNRAGYVLSEILGRERLDERRRRGDVLGGEKRKSVAVGHSDGRKLSKPTLTASCRDLGLNTWWP